ncbi:short-chain dehydrogenase [Williamsia sp. 1138]|uniref:SDR family oxidoreductase n=1 Tax=Gordonia rubripertincta TaxID=36822 RepID=A0ABT4MQS1_GORRU|nr:MULTISPECIES: SDR family oxidoreductase [Mycobacteriales]MCZ4549332.1 SDR family oxidoreductase [Gordonia rubripertincta]OZG29022.1 short-chain dehydrogenase [Williamsia sp. 1138]
MTSRSVFITGAAAGIGRHTALTFARKGYSIGAYDIDEAGLATLAEEVKGLGAQIVTGHLDVTDAEEFTTRLDEFAAAGGGRLDVLINNAGILLAGAFEEIPLATQHKQIDINIKGVTNGCHSAYRHLKATPGSVVVNIASASAIYGQAELASYSATKFYVRGLTEALDIEWGPQGIRVVAMWPLFVQTAMTANVSTGTTNSLGIKLGPQDVADAIVAAVEESKVDKLIHRVHYAVGNQTRAMSLGARFSPAWLTRVVNKKLAQPH